MTSISILLKASIMSVCTTFLCPTYLEINWIRQRPLLTSDKSLDKPVTSTEQVFQDKIGAIKVEIPSYKSPRANSDCF